MNTAHIFISGFVQGVGFRQFVKHSAKQNGVTGWVRNLPASPDASLGGPDGRVEAIFQGSKENIERMIQRSKKGSLISEVEDVVIEWENSSETFAEFVVIKR